MIRHHSKSLRIEAKSRRCMSIAIYIAVCALILSYLRMVFSSALTFVLRCLAGLSGCVALLSASCAFTLEGVRKIVSARNQGCRTGMVSYLTVIAYIFLFVLFGVILTRVLNGSLDLSTAIGR